MSPRTDYYDDPQAPASNSLVPAASAVVFDDQHRVLVQLRHDNRLWALPGGTMQPGETIAATAIREVKEETGLDIEIVGLVGIYSDPKHVIAYDDGEVRQQFNVCFRAHVIGGKLTPGDDAAEARYVENNELQDLPMHPTTRLRIEHALEKRQQPYVD